MTDHSATLDLVLPCRDEAAAIPALLARVPAEFRVVLVDNGSTDHSGEIARSLGVMVIVEPRPGYGAAVAAGLAAATAPVVAVMDCDGSVDPRDLGPLVDDILSGRCDLACGRRRPSTRGSWPWYARCGNALLALVLRRRSGIAVRDLAPVRVGRREVLERLDVLDRRSGYPVETLIRAARCGLRITEHDLTYHPRASGTRSKVTGSLRGTVVALQDISMLLVRIPSHPKAAR